MAFLSYFNVPYTQTDFLFALGNFPYTRVFSYGSMGKIIQKYGKNHIKV